MWRWLLNQLGLILTALAFATIVWAVATSEENPEREAIFPDALPIEFTSPASLVLAQKSVESVRVRVRAPQASWDQLRRDDFRALVDMKSLGPGVYNVPIQVSVNDARVAILSVEPARLNVRLELAKSRSLDARAVVLDGAPLGYASRMVSQSERQVTVSGSASLVDQVAEVIAEVYLRGARSPVEREATLVARDAQGKEIKGIVITPSNILVAVAVEQRVGFKDVSVKTVLRGNVAPGYWVSNIVVSPSTTTVIGSADALEKISGFVETAPLDVNNATTDIAARPTLVLPEGVSVLNNDVISVRVSVTPILGGQTIRRKVTIQNVRAGLTAVISPEQVDVILSGPLPNLQNLPVETATVVVDAVNLGPGVYPVKPRVVGTGDPLKAQSIVPDTVQLVLSEATPPPPK